MSGTDSIEWEAAIWMERRMDGETFDQAAFEAWLAGDPHRRAVYERMWRRIMGSDMDAALKGFSRRRVAARWAAGSISALLLLAGGYHAIPWLELFLATPQAYAVADKAVRKIRLADGTGIVLAGGAEIAVRFSRSQRVVELKRGTMFVDVAQDLRRPFRVDAGEARIADIGTSFEVSSKAAGIRVTVASGIVHVGRSAWFNKPITLTARQGAILTRSGLSRIADVPPDSIAAWRGEWAEYSGAPLRRVIADLQTLAPLPIQIADPDLAGRPTSGRIRLTDPVEQLRNLSIVYGFRVRRTHDALIISKQ